LNYFIPCN